ncbi:MAG: PSD1 and planctomycete cytochrome C domain-containing protein [Bryobacteraceae bacterium]
MRILLLLALAAPPLALPADFARDVYPVLEKRCFACHGAKVQMARLRLDGQTAFERGGQSGPIVRAGDPAASLILKRVEARDGASPMPPAGDRLSSPEIAALREWIASGAAWPAGVGVESGQLATHWAYIAPRRAPLPTVANESWPRTAMDRFLLARMEKESLSPAPEASRELLARRLSLDLTGLPPTIEELDRFLADTSPGAYEDLVDRLLASPHYGERWAQMWLDLARYADTNGYESDEPRTNWAWRDWVIGAFNRNLPFDRFTIEQIAGDLLPNPTEDQVIATGFHRNTLVNSEAGSKDDEFRDAAVKDRADTTATVWLGSTLGCAQCHNHKYDPFTQKDYYRFYAYFNSTAESAIKIDQEKPVFKGDADERQRLEEAVAPLRRTLDTPTPELAEDQREWERRMRAQLPSIRDSWIEIGSAGREQTAFQLSQPARGIKIDGRGKIQVEAWTPERLAAHERALAAKPDWGPWYSIGPFETFTPEKAHAEAWPPEKEIRLDASYEAGKYTWRPRPDIQEGKQQQLDGYNCSIYLYREIRSSQAQPVTVAVGSVLGVKVWLNGAMLVETDPLTPISEQQGLLTLQLRPGVNHLLLKYTNGPGYYRMSFRHYEGFERDAALVLQGKAGVFAIGREIPAGSLLRVIYEPEPKKARQTKVWVTTLDPTEWIATPPPIRTALLADTRTPEQERKLAAHHRSVAPRLADVRRRHDERRKALDDYVEANSTVALVMKELAQPRETYIQSRGDFLSKVEPVTPATPSILPPADGPANRLGLAQWLVRRDNPLTARVAVNHFWRALFGAGLVKTMEDFGSQGDRPVHPELLDWLALDLMDGNWDLKAFLKQIVMSAAYRQSSSVTPEKIAADPANKFFARAPRYRLPAESVRDVVLAASGKLSRKIGGPSVFPPIPPSLFDTVFIEGGFQAWPASTGEDRYRRGLYTFVKRTFAYPPFMAFDVPDRTTCTVDRPRSNTPLQALTTLNDEAFLEAAGAMAETLRDRGIEYGFRAATARLPDQQERSALESLLAAMQRRYGKDPAAARALALQARASSAGLAPWVVVANVILNLDETVTRE